MNHHALELHLQRVFAGPTSNVETELNISAGPWTRTTAAVRWEQVRLRVIFVVMILKEIRRKGRRRSWGS